MVHLACLHYVIIVIYKSDGIAAGFYIYSGLQGYCKYVMLCVHALHVKFAKVHGIRLLANADY